jgi:hypothetical protein
MQDCFWLVGMNPLRFEIRLGHLPCDRVMNSHIFQLSCGAMAEAALIWNRCTFKGQTTECKRTNKDHIRRVGVCPIVRN